MLLALSEGENPVKRVTFAVTLAVFMVAAAHAAEPLDVSPRLAEAVDRRYPRGVDDLREIEAQIQRIAEQVVPATVGIEVGQAVGSGVIVDAEGLVLSVGHVIGRSGRRATVVLPDGRRLPARTLGANHAIDAGMARITDPPDDLPFVPLVTEGVRPNLGDWVVATGQPGGMLDDRTPPVRLGRVLFGGDDWISTDCTLVGGDSGGPLFNMRGEVIALHTSIGPAVVYNFHVPLAAVQLYWQRLLDGEVWGGSDKDPEFDTIRPLLGIAGRDEENRCVITQVFPGLPAESRGVRPGDILLAVDGQNVTSFAEVARIVLDKEPGDMVRLQLERAGRTLQRNVVLSNIDQPLPGGAEPKAGS
jgi:serine protease Do